MIDLIVYKKLICTTGLSSICWQIYYNRRYKFMRWGNNALILLKSSDYDIIA